ncbi:serine hydrolase domain-containing protein [Microbacterium sp. UFMG61]|uniref:serine hydrolase domain-containing protein n=1 Tax=Microbacterium sp. UFMG61 TaxID=2745935 RepID=UPI002B26DF36|nr:serine hydrolase domain-containing protein [Microbacterium sp. UFMG61]
MLLPRGTPASVDIAASAIESLIDRLEHAGIESHSIMIMRRGRIVAEGWWAPYSAERPHLLYSLTKSFTSMAVGLTIDDGLLRLDDRVVDILPEHVPDDLPESARLLTVHHLLTMTAGHSADTLGDAWGLEPNDLVRGFLRMPIAEAPGIRHTYDNATTFVLARMVERVTGSTLPRLLNERLFIPMGITDVEWDRVGSGAVFGFHGLHLTTEAVAAFGELLLRGGEWQGRQLLSRDWVARATRKHIDSHHYSPGSPGRDFHAGYGYQIWMSSHGFHGNGAFGQQCVVIPDRDLVVVLTAAHSEIRHSQDALDAIWECLLPGVDVSGDVEGDAALAQLLHDLALPPVVGIALPDLRVFAAAVNAAVADSALPHGTRIVVESQPDGWLVHVGTWFAAPIGYETWAESSPLGRPVIANGAWQGDTFVAELHLVSTPHRVRLRIHEGTAELTWATVPLTSADLILHLTSPLMTRPDVA